MKKIMMIITTMVIVIAMMTALYVAHIYVRDAKVDKVENNIVTFLDHTGNLWEWKIEDDENYCKNQEVRLIMNNMDTPDISDDTIVKVK